MLCWHREDKERWRDRERLGLIARFKNPFDDNVQSDILYSRLRAPHSVVWNRESGLWFCNSLASELRCNDEVVVRLDTPYFVRGLVVEPPRVWFGASPRGGPEGTPEFGRLYEYNTDSGRLRHLDIGSEREEIRDIYDIVRTAPGRVTEDGKPVRRASEDRRAIASVGDRLDAAERKILEREETISRLEERLDGLIDASHVHSGRQVINTQSGETVGAAGGGFGGNIEGAEQ